MVKIQAVLSVLNSSGDTKKVAALVTALDVTHCNIGPPISRFWISPVATLACHGVMTFVEGHMVKG